MNIKEGCGRKKTLTGDDLFRIEKEVKEGPLSVSSRQLAAEYEVSQSCMLSALHGLNFEYRSVKPIPKLTQNHMRLRFEFCQRIVKDPTLISRSGLVMKWH